MLGLAAANLVGAVLFFSVYAVAGVGRLSQGAFLACLTVLFALATALWVRTEARHRGLEPVRRVGRIALGLLLVLIAVPALGLMPLFWLDTQLPPEAGLNRLLAPIMTLVLIALSLTVLMNLIGSAVIATRAAVHGARRRTRSAR